MCVVGYDDQVGFDINKDGMITNNIDINDDGEVTIADYEQGAFIVANSWGENWADNGKVYVLYRCLMSRSSFWDRGPFMAYAVPGNSQPRATIRFKAQHNKRDSIKLHITMIDSQNNQYSMHTDGIFKNSGSIPLGGPGTENQDFEWGLDITPLAEKINMSTEEVMTDLQKGNTRLIISFTKNEKMNNKRKKKNLKHHNNSETVGILKELELMYWNKDGDKVFSTNIYTHKSILDKDLVINYPF
jgi:hypothetical protein